jgi:hypothetical protein
MIPLVMNLGVKKYQRAQLEPLELILIMHEKNVCIVQ